MSTAPLRLGIATVSLSGVLADKLTAIAEAGFDGVEIFDNDLVASPLSPAEVARRCADLGLAVDLFQPVRDVEGVPPERFPAVLRRLRRKFEVARQLGAPVVLACSSVDPDAVDDGELRAEQLHRVGELAAEHDLVVAYEALAWGRHVNRLGQAWEAVTRADHPRVRLAVDTFHLLARGDDGTALADVPGERIGFLQVADAPRLDMGLLEWSRHFRSFPGQGTLDVAGAVAATLATGYTGPVSLEVFSDVVREVPAEVIARDAMRSLVFLTDQLDHHLPRAEVHDPAFVEVAARPGGSSCPALLERLGFRVAGRHRSKPVTWWRNGDASVLLNEREEHTGRPRPDALGLVASSVAAVQERAAAMRWPALRRTRGAEEALLPGIGAPSGVHVFVSAPAGQPDDWQRDFQPVEEPATDPGSWLGLDHVGISIERDRLDEEISFHRTLLGLHPGPAEEFIRPDGRLRSIALRPDTGGLRVVLNVVETGAPGRQPRGITQLAFGCTDLIEEVRRLRARGVPLMPVPDNYYVDLGARFDLGTDRLACLREHGVLYDADGEGGELLHVYTPTLAPGLFLELLERRGGYAGYGAPNTHVRLAAQVA